MGVISLPKTVARQRRDCDLNPGRSAPESSTLTTRLSSHPQVDSRYYNSVGLLLSGCLDVDDGWCAVVDAGDVDVLLRLTLPR